MEDKRLVHFERETERAERTDDTQALRKWPGRSCTMAGRREMRIAPPPPPLPPLILRLPGS